MSGLAIRRIWTAVIWLGIAVALSVTAGQAQASPATGKTIEVNLDDKPLTFEKAPLLDKGTTLVPFRPLFEAMGLKVGWNPAQQTVTGTKEGLTIIMKIGSKTATVNGTSVQLLQAPTIIDSYTMVPLRFIGESTQALVAWNPYKPQILVYTDPYLAANGLTKAKAKTAVDKQIAEFKKYMTSRSPASRRSPNRQLRGLSRMLLPETAPISQPLQTK